MIESVVCPKCSKSFLVEKDARSKSLRCHHCRTLIHKNGNRSPQNRPGRSTSAVPAKSSTEFRKMNDHEKRSIEHLIMRLDAGPSDPNHDRVVKELVELGEKAIPQLAESMLDGKHRQYGACRALSKIAVNARCGLCKVNRTTATTALAKLTAIRPNISGEFHQEVADRAIHALSQFCGGSQSTETPPSLHTRDKMRSSNPDPKEIRAHYEDEKARLRARHDDGAQAIFDDMLSNVGMADMSNSTEDIVSDAFGGAFANFDKKMEAADREAFKLIKTKYGLSDVQLRRILDQRPVETAVAHKPQKRTRPKTKKKTKKKVAHQVALTTATCDICGKTGRGSLVSSNEMRYAVNQRGFDPFRLGLAESKVLLAAGMTVRQIFEGWKSTMVANDTGGWHVCERCMKRVKRHLPGRKSRVRSLIRAAAVCLLVCFVFLAIGMADQNTRPRLIAWAGQARDHFAVLTESPSRIQPTASTAEIADEPSVRTDSTAGAADVVDARITPDADQAADVAPPIQITRVWTDDQGRKSQATLVRVVGESIRLRRKEKEFSLDLDRLSQSDRSELCSLSDSLDAETRKRLGLPIVREWTDSTGTRRVLASMLRADQTTIRMLRSDGLLITMPIDRLSQADRDYIRSIDQDSLK